MAGIGSAWGSREEMLHPRDRHGRFRKKWKMAASVVDALSGFLDRFSPRTFQSDQQASQYAFNHKKSTWTDPELRRLHTDWDDANESLQAGEMDPTTKKFVDMMDRNMVATQDDLIVSQTVPVEAFGLNPQTAALEEGGLEDLIGLEIGDAGYGDFNLGTELSHPPGSVTLRVALPKGTRVAYGGRSPNDRALFVDRDQPLVVTKVEPDGRGGWYILAIAGSGKKTQGATAVAGDRTHGRRGGGLTPEQREARVTPQMSGEERLRVAQQNEREMQTGPSAVTPAPGATTTPTPAPAAPASSATPAPPAAGVPERREPVLKDSVGPGSPEGKSASDIASDAEAAKIQTENAPPAPPEPATPESFRVALATTDLKAPSRGKRQKEFDAARVGIVSGKQHPQDALRQLETDIEVNKRQLDRQKAGTEKPDPELEQDIKDQEALADLISTHHGIPRRGREAKGTGDGTSPTPTPAAPKSAGPKATPGAPSTKKESVPSPAVQEQRGLDKMTKPELLTEAGDAGRARMTKAQLIQAIEAKRAKGEAPSAPAPAEKAPGSKFTPDQERALIERAKKFRGNEKNDEQRRVVGEADAILARRGTEKRISGSETRSEMRKRTAGPGLSDEQKADIKAKAARTDERVRKELEDFDSKNKADLDPLLEAAGLQEDDLDALDKTGASLILGQVREKKISKVEGIRRLKESSSPQLKALSEALEAKPRKAAPAKTVAKKAAAKATPTVAEQRELEDLSDAERRSYNKFRRAGQGHDDAMHSARDEQNAKLHDLLQEAPPRKAAAKKATPAKAAPTPEDAAEEAFKARVAEAGLPDRVTALRAMAKDQKIRGFSTMNKKQLQSALLGDEVPKAGKIAPVSPQKLVPHLEAVESDQAARKLLENHTLADLKELAKSRDIEIPKRGATKDRLKDAILADVRGVPEGGLRQEVKESLTDEIKATGLDISGDDANSTGLRRILGEVDDQDPEDLRLYRDRLEKLAASTRELGDRQGADIFQDVADMMGMRAQRISGVEEPALPVKRVAKKAVPEAPEGEAPERPLEKMLKPELEALATKEGVTGVRKSWSKARLLDEIKKNRRMDSSRGGETDEERIRRELGGLPGGPERDLGPNQGPLQLPDRAPTPEEIAKAEDDARRMTPTEAKLAVKKTTKKAAPQTPAEDAATEAVMRNMEERQPEAAKAILNDMTPEERQSIAEARERHSARMARKAAPAKKATKKAVKKAEADVDRAAEALAPQLKGTFGDQIQATPPDEMRDSVRAVGLEPKGQTSEEMFDNALKDMLESRMRELGMLPEDPKKPTKAQKRVPKGSVAGPKADVPMETADRKQSFRSAWDAQGLQAEGAGGRSLDQVRDDVESGKITPEEGVRRLESEISFNKEDIADLEAQHRGATDPAERKEIMARIRQLRKTERVNAQASKFLRGHVKDEAPVTREELEVKLDGPEKAALDRVDVASLKEAARQEGLGDIEGDDKDAVIQNIAKAVAGRELADRAAKKAAPTGVSTPEQPPVKAAPGTAAGRITTARLTPGTRIMVQPGSTEGLVMPTTKKTGAIPVTVTKVEGVGRTGPRSRGLYRVTVTDDNGNELKLGDRGASQTHMLEPPPKAPKATKKAAQAARDEEAASGIALLARGGNNEPLIEGAPPRKAAKAAVPAKATPKVVDLDNPTRHDAELIGTGLDLDPKGEDRQWLDVVQRDLDRGTDGRQIADGLRREADSQRTLHNITESVGGTEGASPAARINRMELMADRLEGVRPIKKAAPPAKATPGPEKREMGTMQAASAQSKALFDLRNGKSHAEVATALRQAATSVGSREHDVQTTRPLEFTPAEKSSMKRSDAKKLRELAAEIQAQGVAARAVKKGGTRAKAPTKSQAELERDGNIMSGGNLERMTREGQAREHAAKKATVNPNLSSLSDDELRKIIASDQFPQSQKDKVQKELDARARRDLTGVTGELIKAQLDDAMRRLQEADSPAAERSALAGLLRPELAQLADRLGVKRDRAKSVMINGIIDRVKGREAPGASAERAVPKAEAPRGLTTQPPKPHEWGTGGQRGDQHYYHPDGAIPMAMDRLGNDGQLDVGGGESLHNAMGDIATDLVMGRISGNAGVDRLRALSTKLPAGSEARRRVATLADDLDRPAVAMPKLPDDVPDPARRLVQDLMQFPIARATGRFGGATYETSLIDKVKKFLDEKASGNSSLVGMAQDLHTLINNHTHESQEGSMGIQALTRSLMTSGSDITIALQQWAKEIRAQRRTT